MEKHFDFLDSIDVKEEEPEKVKCCSLKENYSFEHGVIKCRSCNEIISNISTNPEWRYYGNNDSKSSDPTRCGMPVNSLLPESSVGSSVSYGNNDKTMNQIRRLQGWNGMPYKERSLYKVFLGIQQVCKSNAIPTIIINEAKSLYTIISVTKISRGANRKGIIAACVYFACKECGVPRTPREVANMFSIDITVMTKGIKKCQEIIFMNKKNKNRLAKSTSINPNDFIERFCNKLGIDEIDVKIIQQICKESINQNIISENTPPSIAAGCIFYHIKNKNKTISKKEISEICKISEVTINKCTKKLESAADDRRRGDAARMIQAHHRGHMERASHQQWRAERRKYADGLAAGDGITTRRVGGVLLSGGSAR
jgi:transcription initiation factor TFIIB